MEQTNNYGLSQWDEQDRILREDFNADNAKLEAALAQEAAARTALQSSMNAAISALETSIANNSLKIKSGSFTATGVSGTRTYNIGVKPKFLLLRVDNSNNTSNLQAGALVTDTICMLVFTSGKTNMNASGDPCSLTDTGFTVYNTSAHSGLNGSSTTLYYWALY